MDRVRASNADWHRQAKGLTPAGVHSNARLAGAETVFERGRGPWLFDVEGNRYVDYMLGRGPAVLGHSPTAVNEAVARAATDGLTLGQATPLEIEAAEAALSVIPWADHIRFTSSGTEAVQAAFRLARAATGRSLIVQFEGMYHGWVDSVSLAPGIDPRSAAPATAGQSSSSGVDVILLPWNDPTAIDDAFARWGGDIAAVITEPVNIFGAAKADADFLPHLRRVTESNGTVLIFDEVVTGFRLQPGSAASLFGVSPDLATFAKGMGAGWPVSAVAGAASLFDGVAEDRVRLSGTYNGNAAAMAAVIATVGVMADGSVHRAMSQFGDRLRAALVETAARHGVGFKAEGHPTAFWTVFEASDVEESVATGERLSQLLRDQRIICYHRTWLPSAAHDDETLDVTVDGFAKALARL